jgi:hypothetical protein
MPRGTAPSPSSTAPQQVGVVVVAEDDHPRLGTVLEDAADQVGRAVQAHGRVDQHQVGPQAGDMGKGVVGRRAAADHLVGVVPGEQRLQRLVEQWLRIRQQHPCHDHPVV